MSPIYTYTGTPRALFGLSQGVNAHLTRADGSTPPQGSTLEPFPGDHIVTDQPYPHPDLHEDPDAVPAAAVAAPAAPETVEPVPEPTPAPVTAPEPASDAPAAEGAPATAPTL